MSVINPYDENARQAVTNRSNSNEIEMLQHMITGENVLTFYHLTAAGMDIVEALQRRLHNAIEVVQTNYLKIFEEEPV